MTIVDELKDAIQKAQSSRGSSLDESVHLFLRYHGKDLLDALDKADRYDRIVTFNNTRLVSSWSCSHCHGSGIGPDGKPCPLSHPISAGGGS